MRVVCLAGGTGGAKLAAGLQDLVGGELAVIANTADDTEVHGLLVCPDPDLITYWLADQIDEERGWGSATTPSSSTSASSSSGPGWLRLSDRDLATCLYRTHFIAEGGTLTAAQARISPPPGPPRRCCPCASSPSGPGSGRQPAREGCGF